VHKRIEKGQIMRATRVLMTADTVGGVWTYALDLAQLLVERGCEVTLATMGGYLPHAEACAVARLRGIHLHESNFKLEWMEDSWADVAQAGEWLLALAAKVQPDIVHLNNFAHGALPWPAPVLMVAHSCVLSWWQAVKGEVAPQSWNRYAAAVRRGLQAADLVAAPTHAMLDALRTHYGPLPAAQVIYNGRDPHFFAPAPKEPFVLAVGRLWDEAKNVAALDATAAAVPWPIYVAGEDHHPDGGQRQFAHVRALGRLAPAQLATWFARAAIYALPARYEPFGLSVLEAALAGCALVLGDIPSLREVWGDAALYVAPEDPAALGRALNCLAADQRLRQRLAAAAGVRAQQYTQAAMGEGYWRAYQALLADARLPTAQAVPSRPAHVFWSPATVVYQPSTQSSR
jgi:glycosyltransferase involved in cell wall biosynthesis